MPFNFLLNKFIKERVKIHLIKLWNIFYFVTATWIRLD